jgi:hypothetical protein
MKVVSPARKFTTEKFLTAPLEFTYTQRDHP